MELMRTKRFYVIKNSGITKQKECVFSEDLQFQFSFVCNLRRSTNRKIYFKNKSSELNLKLQMDLADESNFQVRTKEKLIRKNFSSFLGVEKITFKCGAIDCNEYVKRKKCVYPRKEKKRIEISRFVARWAAISQASTTIVHTFAQTPHCQRKSNEAVKYVDVVVFSFPFVRFVSVRVLGYE